MENFLEKCREYGIYTRIVKARVNLEFEEAQEINGAFLEEFIHLNQFEENSIERWIRNVKGKDFDGDEVMLELLSEIYKKLDLIQRRLDEKSSFYIPLQERGYTECIGHQVLCFSESKFQSEAMYYVRLDLPIFPREIVPCFCKALTPQILQIIKMGEKHMRQLDSYVVECERLAILQMRKEN